jgi:predicted metal-dependent hydrolase
MSTIKSIDFVSKLPEFDFNNIPELWCEPRHLRVFWDAVSIITPEAEKYIMRSVRAYLNDPIVKENPWLEQLIDEFNAQERQHTFIHTELNKAMGIHEIDMRSRLQETMQQLTKNLSKIENLAITAAMEHLFFSVIKLTFIDTGFYKDESVDEKVKKVFLWHWCEELEHHSVSINLLQALDSSWQTRVKAAQKMLTKFLPVCVEIIIDIERLYSPKHYRMHSAIDIPQITGYFRKGIGVTGKYFDTSYDVIEAGEWSWAYIEQWRSQLGFAAPVKIIESGNIKLAM